MKKILLLIIVSTLVNISIVFAQTVDKVALEKHVKTLASDAFGGRKPGTEGGKLAVDYISNQFAEIGLSKFNNSYTQDLEVIVDVESGLKNELKINGEEAWVQDDFLPLAISADAELTANCVFVSYGMTINEDSLKWDDYADIDVKGKWVLVLRADPELDNNESKFIPYSALRTKVINAQDKGAAGILFVAGVELEKEDKLIELTYEKSSSQGSIPVFSISRNIANKILKGSGESIENLESKILKDMKPIQIETKAEVFGKSDLEFDKTPTQNIFGFVPGNDPKLKDEYIVIGAHYDHLGMGGFGSGSRKPDTNAVHNGADDNASGVAAVIELANEFMQSKSNKRSLIFVAFAAEEMGILGSKYFVKNSPVDVSKIKAMINFDMLGRLDYENPRISISGVGTSPLSKDLVKALEDTTKFKIATSDGGFGPSDHASFYSENIPVFFLSTGAHSDYHTPEDDWDKINYNGMRVICEYTYKLIDKISNRDENLVFQESGPKKRTKYGRGLKVTFGIMPDFTNQDIKGLGVGGVRPDGPASQAGMEKGDIIVAIDGKEVKDIYEYMHRLQALKKGMTVNVDVLRGEKKKVLIIQL